MTKPRAYLDYNATTPLRPEARRAVEDMLGVVGNPSSVHAEGRQARAAVEKARARVADLVGAAPKSVVFTSGATEANVTVLHQARWKAIAVTAVEHPSVIEPARSAGVPVAVLPVGADGRLSPAALQAWLAETEDLAGEGERLVSVQWANNETGVIQPLAEIADIVATAAGVRLHIDAVQAAGRVAIESATVGAAYLTLSSHKIGGPQGVGAIIQGAGGEIRSPLVVGGGQESRLRAGTENVAGIVGFGAAADEAKRDMSAAARIAAMRDALERQVMAMAPDAVVVGGAAPRLHNTSCIAFPGRRSETLVIAFDLAGVAVSSGAACSSGKVGRSHVLEAMGLSQQLSEGAVRISMGWATQPDDIETFLAALRALVTRKRAAASAA